MLSRKIRSVRARVPVAAESSVSPIVAELERQTLAHIAKPNERPSGCPDHQALTRSLAVEWGNRGIRMTAIAPGPIPIEGAFLRLLPRPELEKLAKQRNPLGRFGTVEEFANLAAFLVSDGAGYIDGEVITMDGGEWFQGAGEFTALGRLLTEKDWEMMKPKKK